MYFISSSRDKSSKILARRFLVISSTCGIKADFVPFLFEYGNTCSLEKPISLIASRDVLKSSSVS